MSLSIDKPIAIPVEVVCTSGPLPLVAEGRVSRFTDGTYVIDLDQDVSYLKTGSVAILNFLDQATPRVIAEIQEAQGNRLVCNQRMVRERERRDFPRLVGGLPVRYRVLSTTEEGPEAQAWLAGDDAPLSRGSWQRPDELMNFSVSGLRFDVTDTPDAGALLLIELGVRGRDERWRCTARVVRTFPSTGDHAASVAIAFEDIPEDAQSALSEMTLDLQEALL